MKRSLPLALLVGWIAVQATGLGLYNRNPPHGADGLREVAATLRQAVQPVAISAATAAISASPLLTAAMLLLRRTQRSAYWSARHFSTGFSWSSVPSPT